MSGRMTTLEGLKGRMQWLQARQAVLAGNVAHGDTPGFRPSDLAAPDTRGRQLALVGTAAGHLARRSGGDRSQTTTAGAFETRPSGNAVNLEDEMLKLAETQIEHQVAAGLYQRSISYMRIALGRRG